jgi:hypothetical protein
VLENVKGFVYTLSGPYISLVIFHVINDEIEAKRNSSDLSKGTQS